MGYRFWGGRFLHGLKFEIQKSTKFNEKKLKICWFLRNNLKLNNLVIFFTDRLNFQQTLNV
jgi:hypothetical protein